ncbi:class I mannose-6-phosphate isomerase [soil metagenome]
MTITMYPLRFEPIFQYRLWGGRRLAEVLDAPLPGDGPIGEAWLLSDRSDHASRIANGPLKGRTLGELLVEAPEAVMGALAGRFDRFPLLLKLLDAQEMLSVQVHPSDAHSDLLPAGESGKTEAWVVLRAGPQSRIYAGLKSGTTPSALRAAIDGKDPTDFLAGFRPEPSDAVLVEAGTVHSLGGDVVVFEIQQNSDVTFRLYDWNHVDPRTGKPRALQVDQALACVDFAQGPILPVVPVAPEHTTQRERLLQCEKFALWRVRARAPFPVGAAGEPRVLLPIEGEGQVEHDGQLWEARRGEVVLLPAALGSCIFRPRESVTLLEMAIPAPSP